MKKGQSLIVSAVLMVLLIVSLASGILLFGRETITDIIGAGEEEIDERVDKTKASIGINSVHSGDEIEVRNIGEVRLPVEFNAYFNDTPYDLNYDCGDFIDTGKGCNLTADGLSQDVCNYDITLYGPYETWDTAQTKETCN